MQLSETRKGELAIISNELLWALFPVLTVISYAVLPPFVSLAGGLLFSSVLFAALISIKGKWREVLSPGIWLDLLWTTVFISIGYYVFYFWGLKYTSPGNASIVALMETFFTYLFFNVWRKEAFGQLPLIGTGLMLLGALIVLFPQGHPLNKGDGLILIATALAPVGNFFQQRVRRKISSEVILLFRNLMAFPVIGLIIFLSKDYSSGGALKASLPVLLLNGFVVIGITKILWLEGIHRISVTKANALACVAPFFTLLFAFWFLHQRPLIWQWLSLIPMALGLVLLTYQKSPALNFTDKV